MKRTFLPFHRSKIYGQIGIFGCTRYRKNIVNPLYITISQTNGSLRHII